MPKALDCFSPSPAALNPGRSCAQLIDCTNQGKNSFRWLTVVELAFEILNLKSFGFYGSCGKTFSMEKQ